MKPADFKYSGLKHILDSCVVMASLSHLKGIHILDEITLSNQTINPPEVCLMSPSHHLRLLYFVLLLAESH